MSDLPLTNLVAQLSANATVSRTAVDTLTALLVTPANGGPNSDGYVTVTDGMLTRQVPGYDKLASMMQKGDTGAQGPTGPTGPQGPAGQGNVNGPSTTVSGNVPVWDNTTGTLLAGGRNVGVNLATSLLDRAAGDGRYSLLGHVHTTAQVTGLDAALAGKQAALGFTAENAANRGAANGYASLGSDGKILTGQLPSIALTDTFEVGSQAAMLALTAQRGDIAIRSDVSKTFILASDSPQTLADWKEIISPVDGVSSIAGLSGAVSGSSLKAALSIGVADVASLQGLLDGKASLSGANFTGQVLLPATSVFKKEGVGNSEGGQFYLEKPDTNGFSYNTVIDMNGSTLRFFEGGGSFRGAYLDLGNSGSGANSLIWTSGNFNPADKASAVHSHDWAQVTGKPNLLTYGQDSGRLHNLYVGSGSNTLIYNDTNTSNLVFRTGGAGAERYFVCREDGQFQLGNGSLAYNDGYGARKVAGADPNLGTGGIWNPGNRLWVAHSGGAHGVWDTSNFTPSTKADYSDWANPNAQAYINSNGQKCFASGVTGGDIASQAGVAALELRGGGTGTGAAFMQLHRPGSYATNLGLDTDNRLKIGGWSYGATADHIWHNGNIPTNKWQRDLGNTNRFWFQAGAGTVFGSADGYQWRKNDDTQSMSLTNDGVLTVAGATVSQGGIYTNGNEVSIRGGSPTIFFRDTDNRSAMIHVNSNTMHFLRGAGNDTSAWETVNGRWPLTLNLETNDATFGGSVDARTHVYAGNNVYAGGEVYAANWFRVQGGSSGIHWEQYSGGWYMTDATYMRVYNNKYLYSAGSAGFDGNVNMGSFAVFSDARLKTDIVPLTGHGALIDALNVKSYMKCGKVEWGVIAQEVEEIEPLLVSRAGDPSEAWGDDPLRTVDSNSLMFAMLAELKELRSRVAELETLH